LFAYQNGQQYYSTSGGESWTAKTDPIFNNTGALNTRVKGDTIIALGDNKILLSKNFGASWEAIRLTDNFFLAYNAAFLNDKLYVASHQGLFASSDLSTPWTKVSGLPEEGILDIKVRDGALYAGTTVGLYVSYDAGLSWYTLNDGLGDLSPRLLAFNSDYAFFGTYGLSVWRNSSHKLNVRPTITGVVSPLELTDNLDIQIDINNFRVTDPDNEFPKDFTLTVRPGNDYTFSGSVVTPAPNFNGELKVKLVVNDGHHDSNEYVATVDVITGISETLGVTNFFPNPVHQTINFTLSGEVVSYSIKDFMGRTVIRNDNLLTNADVHSIDVSGLPKGIYFIELQGRKNRIQKFLKY
jgi:hypothetical protein